jgi:hypothetical protein
MELALQRTADQVVTIDRNLFHGCDENGLARTIGRRASSYIGPDQHGFAVLTADTSLRTCR